MTDKLITKINNLKEEKDAVILAHNYQEAEIQELADYTGDSLGLSRKAANLESEVILFCGVKFMAQSAAILSPQKTVLLPEKNAECPMAKMISRAELKDLKDKHPKAAVVCYVNSSAEVKAESDVCCTSSNAVEIVKKVASEKVIFVPDRNLGAYVAQKTDKEIICEQGYCPTHARPKAKDIEQVRKIHPQAKIVVHPECEAEVISKADFVGSTAEIIDFAKHSRAEKIIVGTEAGILHQLEKDNPDKTFYILNQALICRNMKLVRLENIVAALENMEYQINVEEKIRKQAQIALNKMLELSN